VKQTEAHKMQFYVLGAAELLENCESAEVNPDLSG